jgi:hypothetical protein
MKAIFKSYSRPLLVSILNPLEIHGHALLEEKLATFQAPIDLLSQELKIFWISAIECTGQLSLATYL